VLGRLERRGFITREAHALDRRRAHLYVTIAGHRLNRPIAGAVEDAVKRLIARSGARRIAVTGSVLTQLTESLLNAPGRDE
jgi:DNA-binding MarR family transcriptional regulator